MLLRTHSLLLIASLYCGNLWASEQANPDLETTTSNGTVIRVFSELSPLQINKIHSWQLDIRDKSGAAAESVRITVSGGMPEHDHGLPTQPLVTGQMANGMFRLEGIRFHMPGNWQMVFTIEMAEQVETAILNFEL